MTDLRAFLSEATNVLSRLEESMPIAPGPVLNPLHLIAQQLGVTGSQGKALKVVRNILMASAMLICISSTFKPILAPGTADTNADEDRGWVQHVFEATSRFVHITSINLTYFSFFFPFAEVE